MTTVDPFYEEAFPCNRLPGHGDCERKFNKNCCPARSGDCVSRQPGHQNFQPVKFFLRKAEVNQVAS